MKLTSFFTLLLRLTVISLLALYLQIMLAINSSSLLLSLQNWIHNAARSVFSLVDANSTFQVTYNFLNGNNIIVHTLFILVAYFIAYLLGILFRWVTAS